MEFKIQWSRTKNRVISLSIVFVNSAIFTSNLKRYQVKRAKARQSLSRFVTCVCLQVNGWNLISTSLILISCSACAPEKLSYQNKTITFWIICVNNRFVVEICVNIYCIWISKMDYNIFFKLIKYLWWRVLKNRPQSTSKHGWYNDRTNGSK